MKTLLLTCSLVASVHAFCQTPIIAHKSHSGSKATFFVDPNTNFGQIMMPEDLERRRVMANPLPKNTPNIYIDTMVINDSVSVVNHKTYHQKIVKQETIVTPKKSSGNNQGQTNQDQKTKKSGKTLFKQKHQTKHSYLLFLFGFTFGGLFLTRIFKR